MERETIEAVSFFLIYHGHGYSQSDTDEMTLDELFARGNRLLAQKKAEQEAHEEAMKKAKVRGGRRR